MATTEKIRVLGTEDVIGKAGTMDPFPIRLQRGLYFYIRTEQFERLKQMNDSYKLKYKFGVEPLKPIKIIGRGGIAGYRPFLVDGQKGEYLCILAEDYKQLMEINVAYEKILEKERKNLDELKRIEAERKRYLEEEKIWTEHEKKPHFIATPEFKTEPKQIAQTDQVKKPKSIIKKEPEKNMQQINKTEELEGRYVYCIVPSTEKTKSFGNIGVKNNGEVYTINYKDIAIVVSNIPMSEYAPTEEYTRSHERVARTVLEECSVIPAAFGQIFKNEKILRTVLRKTYKTLNETLRLVDNKIELGIKVVLPKAEAETLNEKRRNELQKSSFEILNHLNKKAVQFEKGKLYSDRLVLNSSFLVDKDKIDEFSDAVDRLGNKHKDLKIRYSGPWPPYSFVYLKIGADGVNICKSETKQISEKE